MIIYSDMSVEYFLRSEKAKKKKVLNERHLTKKNNWINSIRCNMNNTTQFT